MPCKFLRRRAARIFFWVLRAIFAVGQPLLVFLVPATRRPAPVAATLMSRRIVSICPVIWLFALHAPIAQAGEPRPELARLRSHVTTLASPEYQGRRGAGGQKAAEYLIAEFRRLGLEPSFDGAFSQSIPGRDGEPPMGRNIGAILRGGDPRLRDEFVILSAHFDHLGVRAGVVYPGADDNASGVAMMLEVARCLVEGGEKPRRSVMFIGFDLEEVGLFGSRYFVEHAPVPLARIALFITADMIGRALGGVCDPYVFVLGSENAPGLRPWLDEAAKGAPVTVGLLGSDLLLLNRSDYGPFRSKKIPYLFFSTGENPLYHSPLDVAETLDYPKLEAISRIIQGLVRKAVQIDQAPGWSAVPDNPFAEAVTIRIVIRTLLEHRETLKIGAAQTLLMNNTLRTLDAIAKRGAITPEERIGMVRATRIILISVF
jgi:hypothetical protein